MMFPFSLFQLKQAEHKPAGGASKETLTPESRVIALSKVDHDGFIDVDLKQLSYAEVAALKLGEGLKPASRAKTRAKTSTAQREDGSVRGERSGEQVIEASELGKDISDVQMAEAIARDAMMRSAAMYDADDDEAQLLDLEEFKRVSKKKAKKLNKRGKGSK